MTNESLFVIAFLLISSQPKFTYNFEYTNSNTNGYGSYVSGYEQETLTDEQLEPRGPTRAQTGKRPLKERLVQQANINAVAEEFANFDRLEPGYDEPVFPDIESLIGTTTTITAARRPACGRRRPISGPGSEAIAQTEDEMLEFDESPRIVGGQIAEIRRWPWQASLHAFGYHICGGSLIDSQHVVTAAHCFQQSEDPGAYTIYLGKSEKEIGESGEVERKVAGIAIHPRYNRPRKHDSDIAVIRLARPVQFSSTVVPICMPRQGDPPPPHGTRCYVTGYGETKGTGGTGFLKEAAIPIIDTARCKRLGSVYQKLVTENMICSGVLEGGVDSCQGDSGGPLVCETKPRSGNFILQGIVSFGIGCAGRRSPGVYTRVSNFIPWLRRVTQASVAAETE